MHTAAANAHAADPGPPITDLTSHFAQVVLAGLRALADLDKPEDDHDVLGADITTLDDAALWRHLRWSAADGQAAEVGILTLHAVNEYRRRQVVGDRGDEGWIFAQARCAVGPEFALADQAIGEFCAIVDAQGMFRWVDLPASVTALGESLADRATLPDPAWQCTFGLSCHEGLWILPGQPVHGSDAGLDPAHAACVQHHLADRSRRAGEILTGMLAEQERVGAVGVFLDVVEELLAESIKTLRLEDITGQPRVLAADINERVAARLGVAALSEAA